MVKLDINNKSCALLVMDVQVTMVNSLAPSEREKVLSNLIKAIRAARIAGISVIYVTAAFRKGHPEIPTRNVRLSKIKENGRLQEGAADTEICHDIRPQPEDIIVIKKRISAFVGSDLEVVLRSKNIDTLVLTGVSSLGVVESTARSAFDLDYRLFVLGDCCSDRDSEANDLAIKHFLPWLSTVCTTDDFVNAIS